MWGSGEAARGEAMEGVAQVRPLLLEGTRPACAAGEAWAPRCCACGESDCFCAERDARGVLWWGAAEGTEAALLLAWIADRTVGLPFFSV